MSSSEAGGPAPETEDTQLKELFDNEIARERTRKNRRFIGIFFLSLFVVMALYGIFLGFQPQETEVSETPQLQVPPGPETTQPSYTPSTDMVTPVSMDQQATTNNLTGAINGKANPGFPYWPSGTILYRFDPDHPCSVGETSDFLRAFKIINDKTDGLVSLVKSPEGTLGISCHDSLDAMGASGSSSLWLSPSGFISNATIDVYSLRPGAYECDSYPTLEMRELLHALGFADTSSPGNIMYSGSAGGLGNPCGELDAGIVNCLKNIYSNGKKGKSCAGIPHK